MADPRTAPRTAFVTGATSGFGAALCRRLVAAGWRVVGTGRRGARLEALHAGLGDAFHPLAFDLRDAAALEAAVHGLPQPFRAVDLLVNNAGLAQGTAPAQEADLDDWRTMTGVNIDALLAVTRRLLPTLVERRGAIVNLSSVAASYPYRGGAVYGGTKAFVAQFSLDLRCDLHGTGVRVTSIEPGMCETEFTVVRNGGDQAASDAFYAGVHPLSADDVAAAIQWVAELPPHMNINRLELMPVNQSFAGFAVHRD